MAKGEDEPELSLPMQIAVAITEEEQLQAMMMVCEELATIPEEPTDSGSASATA